MPQAAYCLVRLMEQLQQPGDKYNITVTTNRFTTIKKLKSSNGSCTLATNPKYPTGLYRCIKIMCAPSSGKEVKPVDFGAKVHMLLVDAISFIEHLSYNNFNESTRLQSAIHLQRRYFGACHQTGADAIYATNDNRRYCTSNNIATSFVPKGNEGKLQEQKSQMRSISGKVHSTVVEGSFGNEKNHYLMNKIKAKTKENEKVWILFRLLTCNAMQTAKQMQAAVSQHKQAA